MVDTSLGPLFRPLGSLGAHFESLVIVQWGQKGPRGDKIGQTNLDKTRFFHPATPPAANTVFMVLLSIQGALVLLLVGVLLFTWALSHCSISNTSVECTTRGALPLAASTVTVFPSLYNTTLLCLSKCSGGGVELTLK